MKTLRTKFLSFLIFCLVGCAAPRVDTPQAVACTTKAQHIADEKFHWNYTPFDWLNAEQKAFDACMIGVRGS